MNKLEKLGKRRTIALFISMLFLSIYSSYIYQASLEEIDSVKLFTQIVRFFLMVGLLALVYDGKNWARILLIVLLSIALIMALITIFTLKSISFISEIPFYVMIFIYSDAIFHFGFSKSYKAFFQYQNNRHS